MSLGRSLRINHTLAGKKKKRGRGDKHKREEKLEENRPK